MHGLEILSEVILEVIHIIHLLHEVGLIDSLIEVLDHAK